jgi:hypothetical protein
MISFADLIPESLKKNYRPDLPGFENLAGLREGIPLLHYQVEDIFLPAGTITIL